jgi:hypothetical protein
LIWNENIVQRIIKELPIGESYSIKNIWDIRRYKSRKSTIG